MSKPRPYNQYGSIDHNGLTSRLHQERVSFVATYDQHPVISELYGGWCDVIPYSVGSKITHKKIVDVLIRPNVLG